MGTTTTTIGIGAFNFNGCSSSSCRITIRKKKKELDFAESSRSSHFAKLELNFAESCRRSSHLGKLELGAIGSSHFGKLELGAIGRRIGTQFRCKAVEQTQNTTTSTGVYQGVYGPWTIDSSDVREVILYRSGLVTAAISFVLASSTAFLPGNSLLRQNLDLFYLLGSAGLGLSLYLIHIYVTEIKRTMQAFWALGVIGSLVAYTTLAQPAGEGLVQYVVDNPTAVWLVGPVFAALTGLVFKEDWHIRRCREIESPGCLDGSLYHFCWKEIHSACKG
ncbi:hypothetical protein SOVF_178360 isoform B [Spinacia oleracea]|uniref:Uncharacterized protein isoform X2 n=1 Tax=Spinacia oleracea TaxID=3562 RepID=A0ABM3QJX2_SPIOL|nr:uncharacterized protein LOC110805131 isoform X2 [Spinacia oleracea]KNA06723.1 hypothetical protein SOVF_178360 isoform B [Spinacia oleracea]